MRKIPVAIALTVPTPAFASGGEVFTLLWLELALLLAVVASILFSRLPFRYRLGVFVAYCLDQALALSLVGDLPYLANQLLVNTVSILVPLGSWLAALVISKRHCKPTPSAPNGARTPR